jgi:hypothetical protein
MAFENMDQAAQALAAAVSNPDTPAQSDYASGAPTGDPTPLTVQPESTTPTGEPGDQGYTPPAEPTAPEFTPSKEIDLSGLSDEQRSFLDAREKEMQAHFTRRMQEVSQTQQEAEQAIQFIQELNTNPFFAQQVVETLSTQLQANGLSPAQANAQAQQQVYDTQQQGQLDDYGYEEDGFDDDPYMQEIRQLRAQQEQVNQYLAQQQEAQRVAALESQLHRQAAAVQQANTFSDADMMKVVNLSFAYGGNLEQAANEYKAIKDAALQDYISSRQGVTAPAPVPSGGSAQAAPEKFTDLNDPRLEQAAIRRLNEALGT